MKKEETLILGREDMFETQQGKNILLIDFTDFKISVNKILENGIIVFIDNNGDTKILKNRFGDKGNRMFIRTIDVMKRIESLMDEYKQAKINITKCDNSFDYDNLDRRISTLRYLFIEIDVWKYVS